MPMLSEDDTWNVATLGALPVSSVKALVSALASAPLISNSKEMAARVAGQLSSIPKEKLSSMLDTLYTLYHVRELSGVKPSRFLDDVIEDVEKNPLAAKKIKTAKFRSTLEALLSIDSLNTISKAARLQRDGEHLYCSAKILSDVRPVFASEPTNRPAGAVLTHTLKVGYHEGRDHRNFYVILDSEDLEALREVVERAKAKDKALRDLMKDAKLPNLGE